MPYYQFIRVKFDIINKIGRNKIAQLQTYRFFRVAREKESAYHKEMVTKKEPIEIVERKINMSGKERHMYPGNNTPEGFFSYYHYILDQREADKIICIKGGPGVGKSTFMKKIGEKLLKEGHDIDFMHCSSDKNSIDGILLKDRKIAMVDGTAPHVIDPINPGAVDSIIHLGDFWNEEGIRQNKEALIDNNERVKNIFARVYNYLAAAGKMYENVKSIYESALKKEEIYKISARIIGVELSHREISHKQGNIKKFFASAITPQGFANYIESLLEGYKRVYLIKAPVGVSSEKILNLFMESSLYRGFDVEAYYCPMSPATKVEHLLVPQLGLAFATSNAFHPVKKENLNADVITIDLQDVIQHERIKYMSDILLDSQKRMEELLEKAIYCLTQAKKEHDDLEAYYIPNMDFAKIEALREEVTEKICKGTAN